MSEQNKECEDESFALAEVEAGRSVETQLADASERAIGRIAELEKRCHELCSENET